MNGPATEWRIYRPGKNPEIDRIVMRRLGSAHDKPCLKPSVKTCALWECQFADRCRLAIPQGGEA